MTNFVNMTTKEMLAHLSPILNPVYETDMNYMFWRIDQFTKPVGAFSANSWPVPVSGITEEWTQAIQKAFESQTSFSAQDCEGENGPARQALELILNMVQSVATATDNIEQKDLAKNLPVFDLKDFMAMSSVNQLALRTDARTVLLCLTVMKSVCPIPENLILGLYKPLLGTEFVDLVRNIKIENDELSFEFDPARLAAAKAEGLDLQQYSDIMVALNAIWSTLPAEAKMLPQ